MSKKVCGILAALIANLIFGFSFIFSKSALLATHPLVILSVRFTIAFLAINLVVIIGKVKLNLKGKKIFKLALMGLAQPLLYFIFELYGLSLVSSALSGVIIALVPVVVMLLALLFLKEKPTFLQIVCTALSLIAVSAISIISNDGSKTYVLGVILLAMAVVCASVFNILSREQSQLFSPIEKTYIMFLLGMIGFNILALSVLGKDYFSLVVTAFSNNDFIVAILYLSVLSSVGAFLLYNYSTSVISAVQAASFSNIIPVVTVMAGVLILKENFSITEYLLCLVIILGVWGVNAFTKNKKA